MSFKDYLAEMTMRGGNFDSISDSFAQSYESLCKTSEHVGDIGQLQVRKLLVNQTSLYSLWDGMKYVSMLVTFPAGDYHEVRNIWVATPYRGQKIMSKFLWFLKSRENLSKMLLGPVHSEATQKMVTHGLSRFDKSWFNGVETKPFDASTLDFFYSHKKPTGWQVMLENDGMFDWPKFSSGTASLTFIEENYDWIVDDADI